MPQNPVKSELFVSQIIAGAGMAVSPTHGTGIVTVSATGSESFTTLGVSGKSALHTTQVTGFTATQLAVLSTTQMAGLTSTQLGVTGVTGTVTINGATPTTTVGFSGMTSNTLVLFTMKTPGGTVAGAPPNVNLVIPGVGFTAKGIASDTSTYNFLTILAP